MGNRLSCVLAGVFAGFALTGGGAFASPLGVPAGSPIDENYRQQFAQCDAHDVFQGIQFPVIGKKGQIAWYGCKTDPSRFSRFERVAARSDAPEAIIVEGKLAWDDDGSPGACSANRGPTSQCPTSLKLDAKEPSRCVLPSWTGKQCIPLNADIVPTWSSQRPLRKASTVAPSNASQASGSATTGW